MLLRNFLLAVFVTFFITSCNTMDDSSKMGKSEEDARHITMHSGLDRYLTGGNMTKPDVNALFINENEVTTQGRKYRARVDGKALNHLDQDAISYNRRETRRIDDFDDARDIMTFLVRHCAGPEPYTDGGNATCIEDGHARVGNSTVGNSTEIGTGGGHCCWADPGTGWECHHDHCYPHW